MEVQLMQLVHHSLGIGIVLVEYEFAFAIPPEPVLNDIVHRNMQVAVFLRNAEYFLLRFVAVLALPESICPLAEHWGLPGQLTIAGNNFVEFRPIKEVVVDVRRQLRS